MAGLAAPILAALAFAARAFAAPEELPRPAGVRAAAKSPAAAQARAAGVTPTAKRSTSAPPVVRVEARRRFGGIYDDPEYERVPVEELAPPFVPPVAPERPVAGLQNDRQAPAARPGALPLQGSLVTTAPVALSAEIVGQVDGWGQEWWNSAALIYAGGSRGVYRTDYNPYYYTSYHRPWYSAPYRYSFYYPPWYSRAYSPYYRPYAGYYRPYASYAYGPYSFPYGAYFYRPWYTYRYPGYLPPPGFGGYHYGCW